MLPEGRRALVTGGNGGIGSRVVERLLARGAKVVVADRDPSACPEGASFVEADLSTAESVYRLGDSMRADPPDMLVNLAGLNAFGAFESMDRRRLEVLMQVNLMAPMQLAQSLLPSMIARGSGQIVNVGSVVGDIGLPYFTAYAASKAGIANFSEALAREVAGRGITVTLISPRAVKTTMNHGAIEQFNAASGASEDSPERVADIIVDAIVRDRKRVTIGFPERLFVKVNALAPSLVDRALTRNRRLAEDVLAAQPN